MGEGRKLPFSRLNLFFNAPKRQIWKACSPTNTIFPAYAKPREQWMNIIGPIVYKKLICHWICWTFKRTHKHSISEWDKPTDPNKTISYKSTKRESIIDKLYVLGLSVWSGNNTNKYSCEYYFLQGPPRSVCSSRRRLLIRKGKCKMLFNEHAARLWTRLLGKDLNEREGAQNSRKTHWIEMHSWTWNLCA